MRFAIVLFACFVAADVHAQQVFEVGGVEYDFLGFKINQVLSADSCLADRGGDTYYLDDLNGRLAKKVDDEVFYSLVTSADETYTYTTVLGASRTVRWYKGINPDHLGKVSSYMRLKSDFLKGLPERRWRSGSRAIVRKGKIVDVDFEEDRLLLYFADEGKPSVKVYSSALAKKDQEYLLEQSEAFLANEEVKELGVQESWK